MISQLVRKQVLKMPEINWGDVPENTGMRLLWGENQQFINLYRDAITSEIEKINLYPSPTKQVLKQKLAEYTQTSAAGIIPTNGSDDALELIGKVFIAEGDEVVIPVPSFPCYESVSQMMGAKILTVQLETDFSLNIKKLLVLVTPKTKVVWLANPNNPTGNLLLSTEQIELLLQRLNCVLVVDECYFELTGVTGAALTQQYPNLVIVRSFSKIFALAGVRLGYLVCNPETATYLNRVQQANQVFGVNRFAQAVGTAILGQPQLLQSSVLEFQALKRSFESKLKEIAEFEVLETKTTFCLVKILSSMTAAELKEQLRKQNIFIKDCSIYTGFGKQYAYLGVPKQRYWSQVVESIDLALKGS